MIVPPSPPSSPPQPLTASARAAAIASPRPPTRLISNLPVRPEPTGRPRSCPQAATCRGRHTNPPRGRVQARSGAGLLARILPPSRRHYPLRLVAGLAEARELVAGAARARRRALGGANLLGAHVSGVMAGSEVTVAVVDER